VSEYQQVCDELSTLYKQMSLLLPNKSISVKNQVMQLASQAQNLGKLPPVKAHKLRKRIAKVFDVFVKISDLSEKKNQLQKEST